MRRVALGRRALPVGRITGIGAMRKLHPGLVVLAALAAGGWQTLDRPPSEAVTIDLVALDPTGRVVQNLGTDDFLVTESGTPQSVEAVQLVSLPAAKRSAAASSLRSTTSAEEVSSSDAGHDASRLIAIYLDEYHVTAGVNADRVRRELLDFVRAVLDPDDLLVVLKPLDPLVSIRLTRDRAAALRSIESFDPRRGAYAARSAFEEEFIAARPERVEAARSQIAVSAVNALATHLGMLGSGRKTLLLVTEGLGAGPRRRGDEPLPTTQTVVRAANRARVSIYPIDPSLASGSSSPGPPADERTVERRAADRQSLDALAKETGGALFTNLSEGLRRALADSSTYYLLTFTSPTLRRDGRFHAVTVRAADPRLSVRARSGYVARAPVEVAEPAGARRDNGLPPLTLRASRLIRPWFGTARGPEGRTRVTFVWEPAPRVHGERGRELPSRVTLSVFDGGGVRLFEGAVRPVGASLFGATEDTRAVFESAPGRLRVEMSIQDAAMRRLDSDVRELVVGRFPGPIAFGTAQVFRARSAREVRVITEDANPVPVASRQFSRADRLILRVPVYVAAGAATPAVSARLVSGFGSTMRELPVDRGPGIDIHQIDVSLAGLAPGDYAVDLRVQHPEGVARDTVAFRVTP